MKPHLEIEPGAGRLEQVNAGLLEYTAVLASTLIYPACGKRLRLEVDEPSDALEVLIEAEVISPTEDLFVICGGRYDPPQDVD